MLIQGFFLVAVCLAILGCSGRKANHKLSKQAEVSATNAPDTLQQPKIVTATIANKDGAFIFSQANKTSWFSVKLGGTKIGFDLANC